MTQIESSTRLAAERTRLAYERTMMAWTRTATSLITFGFSIYKFFELEPTSSHRGGLLGSANFALLMIAIGLLALLMAALENRQDVKALKAEYPDLHFPRSLARVFAAFISLLGFAALAAVLLRD